MAHNQLETLREQAEDTFERGVVAFLEKILYQQYASEFRVIDGYRRHPDLVSFDQWMARRFPVV